MLKDITNFFTRREVIENVINYKYENLERFLYNSKEDIFNFIANMLKDTYSDVALINGSIVIRGIRNE